MARWQPLIAEAAQRFGLPRAWIQAVMAAESGGRRTLDGAPITSPAGAIGLMQLMPETYAEMRMRLGLGPDPYAPRDNVLAGTAYLADMYQRYGYPGLFAAYNAGPERSERYLAHGTPLPSETVRYLARIGPDALATVLAMGAPTRPGSIQIAASDTSRRADFESGRGLFFVNRTGPTYSSEPPDDAFRPDAHHRSRSAFFVVRKDAGTQPESQSASRLFVPLARHQF
ncbi:MAG: lytic transglycosylase domain-containing protein [Alphaproteobacteria bacterium]|nr:lytic transglycosylase domain-containing protein [Alphaproteobacteria bacterium]